MIDTPIDADTPNRIEYHTTRLADASWSFSPCVREGVASPDNSALGAFRRREGLHEAQLKEWRAEAEAALGGGTRRSGKRSAEAKRVKQLERELRRKDKALAEASAILVLKKKAAAIWGDEDD